MTKKTMPEGAQSDKDIKTTATTETAETTGQWGPSEHETGWRRRLDKHLFEVQNTLQETMGTPLRDIINGQTTTNAKT